MMDEKNKYLALIRCMDVVQKDAIQKAHDVLYELIEDDSDYWLPTERLREELEIILIYYDEDIPLDSPPE
jgi:hypothetical protein